MIKYRPRNILRGKNLFLFCLSFIILTGSCPAEMIDKIVAVVGEQAITNSEIEEAAKPVTDELRKAYSGEELQRRLKDARREIIERLIEEKLILQEAKKQKMVVTNEEVEGRVRQVRAKFPDEKSFQKALQQQGISLWQLKKTYKEQIMVRKMVRQYVRQYTELTPTQIAEYYQKHKGDFKLPLAADISQILIKYKPYEDSVRTEKVAYQVAELLAMSTDFDSVARKYSEGPNAAMGGRLGIVERGTMAKEIDDVIFNMREGEVSKPIKTEVGFTIIQVNSMRKEKCKPLQEVKGEIEERLLDEAAKTILGKWVKELKDKTFVSIKE